MKKEMVQLSLLTTFRMGGETELISLLSESEVEECFANIDNAFFLGGGSNLLVGEEAFTVPCVKYVRDDISYEERDGKECVRVQAGRAWDDFVSQTVEMGYGTLAALSLIPGTVGAAPVQNIGAYGSEVKDSIVLVRGFDIREKKWKEFTKEECLFSYRKSIFQTYRDFLITEVVFALEKGVKEMPSYGALKQIFFGKESVSPRELRDAVISVRDSKLPRVEKAPSVGSFFKNPLVTVSKKDELLEKYPGLPHFAGEGAMSKLAAGWLIEQSCAELFVYENLSLYERNRLVMTHVGSREVTLPHVRLYAAKIQERVMSVFGVKLEIEPEIVRGGKTIDKSA